MNYQIFWHPRATSRLAELWNDAADRNALTNASRAIELLLATDPSDAGESRDQGFRLVMESPLQVLFKVAEAKKCVFVYKLDRFGRRGP